MQQEAPALFDKQLHHRLPEIYAAVALLVGTLLCLLTPPLHVPDEPNHLLRSYQVSEGVWLPRPRADGNSGLVDSSLAATTQQVQAIEQHAQATSQQQPVRKWALPEELRNPRSMHLSHADVPAPFPNTAVYPPAFYLPQALGWIIARAANLTLLHAIWLVRFCALLASVVVGWVALRVCHCGRPLLFALLLLPSVLSLNGSASQDALSFAVAALAVAIMTRALADSRTLRLAELALVAALLIFTITARVPYLPLALLLLVPSLNLPARWRNYLPALLAVGAVVVGVAVWQALVHPLPVVFLPQADPAHQVLFLKTHPLLAAWNVLYGTLRHAPGLFALGFEALGVNDVRPALPLYAVLIAGVLAIAVATPMPCVRARLPRLVIGATVLLVVLGMSLAEYVIWTAVGAHTVEGLQARYYLPLVPFAFFALPAATFLSERTRLIVLQAATAVFTLCVLYTPWVAAHGFYRLGLLAALRAVLG